MADKGKEIVAALRESSETTQAKARRRERQLLDTLEQLLNSENRQIFEEKVREHFSLEPNDPRLREILTVWDERQGRS